MLGATIVITVLQVMCGKAGFRRFPSKMTPTLPPFCGMSSEMRCGPSWCHVLRSGSGQASPGGSADDPLLWRGELPVRDDRWLERVNEPLSATDLQRLRHSVT